MPCMQTHNYCSSKRLEVLFDYRLSRLRSLYAIERPQHSQKVTIFMRTHNHHIMNRRGFWLKAIVVVGTLLLGCSGQDSFDPSSEDLLTEDCLQECPEMGSRRCVDGIGFEECGDFDSDSCLEWGAFTTCSSQSVCEKGQCVDKGLPFPRLLSFRTLQQGQIPEVLQKHCYLNGAVFSLEGNAFAEAATLKNPAYCPDNIVIMTRSWGYNDFRPGEPDYLPDHRHWLFAVGSDTSSGSTITEESTRIYVRNNDNFIGNEYAAIMSIGDDDRPDWQAYEEVLVLAKGTDANGPYIDVQRGLYGTVAQVFDPSRARVMIHEWGVVDWTGHPRWELNLSPAAPKTSDGYGSAHHLARFFADLYWQYSDVLDGFQFDVAKWTAFGHFEGPDKRGVLLDCDLDGIGDDCYFGGVNTFAVGVMDFFRLLREGGDDFDGVGDDFILIADGQRKFSQRAVPFLNGIEIEDYPGFASNEQYTLLPSALDQLIMWEQSTTTEKTVSYALTKQPVAAYGQAGCPLDLQGTNYRYRIGLVSALLAGTFYAFTPNLHQPYFECGPDPLDGPVFVDEFFAGTAETKGYLGYPLEPAAWILDGISTPIYEAGFETDLDGWMVMVTSPDALAEDPARDNTSVAVGSWSLRANVVDVGAPRPVPYRVKLASPTISVETGQTYTLRFFARSENPFAAYSGDPRYGQAQRLVEAVLRSTNDTDEIPSLASVNLYVGPEWKEHIVTLKVEDEGGPAVHLARINLNVSMDTGPVWIDNVRLYAGCGLVLYRQFEGGLALLNGCLDDPATIDMQARFPGESYRRIDGTVDPVVNNGHPVSSTLTIPPRDALILLRDP